MWEKVNKWSSNVSYSDRDQRKDEKVETVHWSGVRERRIVESTTLSSSGEKREGLESTVAREKSGIDVPEYCDFKLNSCRLRRENRGYIYTHAPYSTFSEMDKVLDE